MDAEAIQVLKDTLVRDVSTLCRDDRAHWRQPIVDTLRELRDTGVRAVLFGGTLRSLLAGRIINKSLRRPRDLDIVVSGVPIRRLKEHLEPSVLRETRFGGLKLRRNGWEFDIWPLGQTWAFVKDSIPNPEFSALPATTFFNLEAIAVDIWPERGRKRQVFSGDEQFFEGLLSRTLEVNREDNPYPDLCVVRALVMASTLDLKIGPRLARYIAEHGRRMTEGQFETIQQAHYGSLREDGRTMQRWIRLILKEHERKVNSAIQMSFSEQMSFWPEVRCSF